MPIQYHIYANDGLGGPVDYTAPVATASSLTWTSVALASPGNYTFAVRAFDTTTGFEESNVDCRITLILDSSGADITGRPNAPSNVYALPTAGGGVDIHWMFSPIGEIAPPTSFLVYLTPGSSPGYGSPAATIPYGAGLTHFSARVSGLTDGATYTASVRATNAIATEPNTTAYATFTADSTPPGVVDGLTATVGIDGP